MRARIQAAFVTAEADLLALPITSSYIESTIKQINRRVEGTEKFWSTRGAEALLQLSADYLCETAPLTPSWRNR